MEQALRFHWSLSQVGDKFRRTRATEQQTGLLDVREQVQACRQAEQSGIESMLMAIGYGRPDPMLLSAAIAARTERIRFLVACRSGLISPAFFVQQINTLSTLAPNRVYVNMVCGHTPHELRYYGDFLSHDERYERTGEFLAVCRDFWADEGDVNFEGKYYRIDKGRIETPYLPRDAGGPVIYLGGNSVLAAQLAIQHAHCLWRFPAHPDVIRSEIAPVIHSGKEAGLLMSLIARPTRSEAHDAADALIRNFGADVRKVHEDFARRSDSTGFRSTYAMSRDEGSCWITPCLWTGAVPYFGAPAIALVGSFEEVADNMMQYRDCGISQFLLTGWPDTAEMEYFSSGVLALVRAREAREALSSARGRTAAVSG